MRRGSLCVAIVLCACACASTEKRPRHPKPPPADVEACEHMRALAEHWVETNPGSNVRGDVARWCTRNLEGVASEPLVHDCRVRCIEGADTFHGALGCSRRCLPSGEMAAEPPSSSAGFRACYAAALKVDPTVAGRVEIAVAIAPDGSVLSATVAKTTLPAALSACVAQVFLGQRFVPPQPGDPTTLTIPVVLGVTPPKAAP